MNDPPPVHQKTTDTKTEGKFMNKLRSDSDLSSQATVESMAKRSRTHSVIVGLNAVVRRARP